MLRTFYVKSLLDHSKDTSAAQTYLLAIGSNTQIDITKGTTTNPLGNAVFLRRQQTSLSEKRIAADRVIAMVICLVGTYRDGRLHGGVV